MKKTNIILIATLLATSNAFAQQATAPQTVKLEQYLIKEIKQPDGKVLEAAQLNPKELRGGDVVEEQITVSNNTGEKVRIKAVRFPIQQGMTLMEVKASGVAVEYSADGKNFSARPQKVTVENGIKKIINVPMNEYQAVRWNLQSLNPKEKKVFKLRLMVK